jgi:polar amino acid transport system substrate-binding protein
MGMPTMARPFGFRRFLCLAIAIVSMLGGRASMAEPLRFVTFHLVPFTDLSDTNAPGFSVEVLRQVFVAMGQEASFEELPLSRGWAMVASGERDGIFGVNRTNERTSICYFPDEPLRQERWVFFVRTADAGRLKFSSFDDLIGHDIAVTGPVGGVYVPPELWKFLREHHNNMVETTDPPMAFAMLASGRVDYVIVNLVVGMREIAAMGLPGKIEPILTRNVMESGYRVCFSKARVDPAFVDAFSNALKQFKETEAFQAISRKYFP